MVGYWRSLLHSGSASSVSFFLILHSSVAVLHMYNALVFSSPTGWCAMSQIWSLSWCSMLSSYRYSWLQYDFFIQMFTLEMLMKVVARGFVMHKHAYLKDWWNCLDFFIVLAGFVSAMTCVSSEGLYALTVTGMSWISSFSRWCVCVHESAYVSSLNVNLYLKHRQTDTHTLRTQTDRQTDTHTHTHTRLCIILWFLQGSFLSLRTLHFWISCE
jgi:hypothetical protein